MLERFKTKYKVNETTGCWEWQAGKHGRGYGFFYVEKKDSGAKMQFAHRVSYMLFKGEIPSGMSVCHSCDNTSCVNPAHLWLGTHEDNMKDMAAKGRAISSRLRLTEKDILFVLQSPLCNKEVAKSANIEASYVSRIRTGKVKKWQYLYNKARG